jgi:hypothetical protein
MPNGAYTLGASVFEGCTNLKAVDISKTTNIGNKAFFNSGLKAILIPDALPTIRVSATNWETDGSFAGLTGDKKPLFLVADKTAYESMDEGVAKQYLNSNLFVPAINGADTIAAGEELDLIAVPAVDGDVYQWYKDDVAISGATSNNYNVAAATATDVGEYSFTLYGLELPMTGLDVSITGVIAPSDATLVSDKAYTNHGEPSLRELDTR